MQSLSPVGEQERQENRNLQNNQHPVHRNPFDPYAKTSVNRTAICNTVTTGFIAQLPS